MSDYEVVNNNSENLQVRSTSYLTAAKSFNESNKNLLLLTLYYQPLFTNPEDYRVNLEANVRTILVSSWNISLDNSIKYMYDTNPPEDILTNDLVVKTNIVYSW